MIKRNIKWLVSAASVAVLVMSVVACSSSDDDAAAAPAAPAAAATAAAPAAAAPAAAMIVATSPYTQYATLSEVSLCGSYSKAYKSRARVCLLSSESSADELLNCRYNVPQRS